VFDVGCRDYNAFKGEKFPCGKILYFGAQYDVHAGVDEQFVIFQDDGTVVADYFLDTVFLFLQYALQRTSVQVSGHIALVALTVRIFAFEKFL